MIPSSTATPNSGKPVEHYVLFGPAAQPATRVYLLLAQGFLQTFTSAFGFSSAEAAAAGQVTIMGDPTLVSAGAEASLVAGGAKVQRIAGCPEDVSAALAQRVAAGKAF